LPDEERYIEALCKAVNLTKYEASIYVALLKHGGWMTARQASFLSRVPRAKTYGALRKLIEVQLAEQALTSPTLYRGVSPKRMLPPIMEEMRNTLRVLNQFAAGNYSQH
jgi:sugar-specific transcriptional regulator TrmB